MREVETQTLVVDTRALLLDVGAQHVAQSLVQQVGSRVVALYGKTAAAVGRELACALFVNWSMVSRLCALIR